MHQQHHKSSEGRFCETLLKVDEIHDRFSAVLIPYWTAVLDDMATPVIDGKVSGRGYTI